MNRAQMIEEWNYANDRRVRAQGLTAGLPDAEFDQRRMILSFQLEECSCPACSEIIDRVPYTHRPFGTYRDVYFVVLPPIVGEGPVERLECGPDYIPVSAVDETAWNSKYVRYTDGWRNAWNVAREVLASYEELRAWPECPPPHEFTLPCKFEVCAICDGRGRHTDPNIDASGLTYDDFADDPDFAEEYHGGAYDVACYGCGGERVEPVVDRDAADPVVLAIYDEMVRGHIDYQRECAAERRMGC